ncbi:MAG: adenosine deaminase family protein [Opitutus sp.]
MASSVRYAELHLHLEGCLDAQTLSEIAPHLDPVSVLDRYRFTNFAGFLESFKFAVMQLGTEDDYRLLARRAFASLEAQGIVYAEIIHSSGICLWRKQDARAIAEALIEEGRNAPIEVRWIFDAVRQLGPEHVMETARLAADFSGAEVVGFGVGGDETGCDAVYLKPAFELAREHGLKLLPHAGETSNAENVWGALELGADRIGHGIRAIEDPRLMAELAARRIPLEISISSNVFTGAVGSYQDHPAKRLHEAGVPILLNTDDPAFFSTTLEAEFGHARRLGFREAELEEIRLNAFRFACCETSGL